MSRVFCSSRISDTGRGFKISNSTTRSRARNEPGLMRRPKRALGLSNSRQPKSKGGGDAGGFPSSTATCTKSEKVQMNCRHREIRITSGVPACLAFRPFTPSTNFAQWFSALYRVTPGGLTKSILRWRAFPVSPCRVWHASHETAKGRPCDERQARRNHATSAAATRLRVQATCGHRFRPPPRYASRGVL
jgi:hypothetical protein